MIDEYRVPDFYMLPPCDSTTRLKYLRDRFDRALTASYISAGNYFFPLRGEIYNFGCAFSLVDAEKMMINAWPGERKVYGTGGVDFDGKILGRKMAREFMAECESCLRF